MLLIWRNFLLVNDVENVGKRLEYILLKEFALQSQRVGVSLNQAPEWI